MNFQRHTPSKVDESIFLNNQGIILCLVYVVFYWTDFSIYNRIGKERRKVTKNEKSVPTWHVTTTLLLLQNKSKMSYSLHSITNLDFFVENSFVCKSYLYELKHLKNHNIREYFFLALLNPYLGSPFSGCGCISKAKVVHHQSPVWCGFRNHACKWFLGLMY